MESDDNIVPKQRPVKKGRDLMPWSISIFDQLKDAEWHDRKEVLTKAARLIPPELGFRRGETLRLRKRKDHVGDRVRGDDSDSIHHGRWALITAVLYVQVNSGKIEMSQDRKSIRLKL